MKKFFTALLFSLAIITFPLFALSCETGPNQASYWEDLGYGTCYKIEDPDGTSFSMPNAPQGKVWTLLVVKAGTERAVYEDPVPGDWYDAPSGPNEQPQEISHVIKCYDLAPPPPPTDLCPNLDGDQATVPDGYHLEEGECVEDTPPPTDVCPNLDGVQTEVPQGYHLEDGECVEDTPPPTDLCANLDGIQETVPEGYHLVDGDCVEDTPPPTDVCPNLDGVQEAIPEGYHLEDGHCIEDVPPPADVCPNIEGDQAEVPEGYHFEEGECVEDTPPPTDVCPNLDGVQETVPEGYSLVEGECVEDTPPPTDLCANLDGIQETVPEGYHLVDGDCVEDTPPPTDVCPNLDGLQEEVPQGYHLEDGECVEDVQEPVDVCPNWGGVQTEIPEGYHLEDGNCVQDEEEPIDMCPNLEGIQATVPEGYSIVDGDCVEDVVPVDVCQNWEGVQEEVPQGYHLEDGDCVQDTQQHTGGGFPPQCSDGADNDGDGLYDYPDDPGCTGVLDNDEQNEVTPPSSSGTTSTTSVTVTTSGGGSTSQPQGEVLGIAFENPAPQFVDFNPPKVAYDCIWYLYPMYAVDPEGEQVTYGLTEGPSGMDVVETTGLIYWCPLAHHVREAPYNITVWASDGVNVVSEHFSVVVKFPVTNPAPSEPDAEEVSEAPMSAPVSMNEQGILSNEVSADSTTVDAGHREASAALFTGEFNTLKDIRARIREAAQWVGSTLLQSFSPQAKERLRAS